MPTVFVDTVAWIALLNKRDSLHDVATNAWITLRNANTRFITSEFVLIEFGNALSSVEFRARAARFIQGLKLSSIVDVVPSGTELFNLGFDLYNERPDKAWSLVDCISFVIMTERNISKAFTQDRHFEQAGFTNLL